MKYSIRVTEILLGLVFLIFGLNGLYTFIPEPEYHPFMQMLVESHFIDVVKVLEIAGGLLLLTRRFILVGLFILGPIILNIILYHILIDPRNFAVGILSLVLYLSIVISYRSYFKNIFIVKPKPDFE